MTTKNEYLSAVLDDEAGEFEQRRLLDEVEKDENLQKNWSSYTLIGDVLREPAQTQIAGSDFLSNIRQKINQEEEYSRVKLQSASKSSVTWLRPASNFAVAAAVTAVSIFGVQSIMTADNGTNTLPATQQVAQNTQTQPSASSNLQVASAADENLSQGSLDNVDQKTRMQRYLASHIRNASRRTIAPTMRVISYNY